MITRFFLVALLVFTFSLDHAYADPKSDLLKEIIYLKNATASGVSRRNLSLASTKVRTAYEFAEIQGVLNAKQKRDIFYLITAIQYTRKIWRIDSIILKGTKAWKFAIASFNVIQNSVGVKRQIRIEAGGGITNDFIVRDDLILNCLSLISIQAKKSIDSLR